MGHAMTFRLLTADSAKVIVRSQVRAADDPACPKLTDCCSSKLGSISLTEGIMNSYLHTIPSCCEYFDSNDGEVTVVGQTLPETGTGQTGPTKSKAGIQSHSYHNNESLGHSENPDEYERMTRICTDNTIEKTIDQSDLGEEQQHRK